MNFTTKDCKYLLISALGAIVVLWQMLLPGYILTLDLVFGPHVPLIFTDGHFFNAMPVWIVSWSLSHIVPGWVVEKIVLLGLFFLLFYVPLRFLPIPRKCGAEYVAAAFFAVNPFVYERMLAGQWLVLAGYALLPLFLCALADAWEDDSWRKTAMPFLWLLIIGVFSLHFLVMASLIYAGYFVVKIATRTYDAKSSLLFTKRALVTGVALIVLSGYWLVPYLLNPQVAPIESFGSEQWTAFVTASDPVLGTVGNVASLYGFWGEHEMWAGYFVFEKGSALFFLTGGLLAVLIALGIYAARREKESKLRVAAIIALIVAVASLVFSLGLAQSFAQPINAWLFAHIFFWRGFRDTEKWSGWLALGYAVFAGFGANWILSRIRREFVREYALLGLVVLVLLYTYPMLGGFSRQLQPVWYPESWKGADAVLSKESNCKALFLPWHLYYTLSFNHDLITASPASRYFTCQIISSQNIEVGQARTGTITSENQAVDTIVMTGETATPDETVNRLRALGFTDIVLTHDLDGVDSYKYPFLTSKELTETVHTSDLSVYSIRGTVPSY